MATVSILNTDVGLSGKTLINAEDAQNVTGLKSYNRSPNAPIAVQAGSAVVTNLDADKLDGQEGTYYTNASNLASGTVPSARMGAPGVRVSSTTSSATPTPNADTDDLYDVTALATAPTFGLPTGTPVNAQRLIIRIKDNGTARALAWNAGYVAGGVALPTTTVISKILTIQFIYNTANALNKWQCVGVAQEQ